jgi:hypothetical protein
MIYYCNQIEYMLQQKDISTENAVTIIEFIKCQKTEINPSDGYMCVDLIFIKYSRNKNFKQLARAVIITYLDSLLKSEEADPSYKWIGSDNLRRQIFLKFLKWLYNPTEEAKKRKIPEVLIFSTNKIPDSDDKMYAYYKRWLLR